MADTKITGLSQDTNPLASDVIVTVDDPGGTAVNKKATLQNIIEIKPVVNRLGGTPPGNRIDFIFRPLLFSLIGPGGGTAYGRISCGDLIRTIYCSDITETFTYSISKDEVNWVESTDPYQAYLTYTCDDTGGQQVYVKVTDGQGNFSATNNIVIIVADDDELCGGGA